jgi:hypothetical protein
MAPRSVFYGFLDLSKKMDFGRILGLRSGPEDYLQKAFFWPDLERSFEAETALRNGRL